MSSKSSGSRKAYRRPTFYMSQELHGQLARLASQKNTTMSRLVVDVLTFLILSSIGEKLQASAHQHGKTLVQELEENLILYSEWIPTEEIERLADASQRTAAGMLVYLVLLGLEHYDRP